MITNVNDFVATAQQQGFDHYYREVLANERLSDVCYIISGKDLYGHWSPMNGGVIKDKYSPVWSKRFRKFKKFPISKLKE